MRRAVIQHQSTYCLEELSCRYQWLLDSEFADNAWQLNSAVIYEMRKRVRRVIMR